MVPAGWPRSTQTELESFSHYCCTHFFPIVSTNALPSAWTGALRAWCVLGKCLTAFPFLRRELFLMEGNDKKPEPVFDRRCLCSVRRSLSHLTPVS